MVTLDRPGLQVLEDSPDLQDLLGRMALMDHLEIKVSRVRQGVQVCQVCLGRRDLPVRRERRVMEVCLASPGLLVSAEREAVPEPRAFLAPKDRKESPLRGREAGTVCLGSVAGRDRRESEATQEREEHLATLLKEPLDLLAGPASLDPRGQTVRLVCQASRA